MIILNILEIISAIILIGLVLMQMQGSGLSSAFGGTGEFYRSKRSVEKFLMYATVVDTIIFGIISILLLLPIK
ncbi:preprotein translocase subunit SecG [Patescibacteria group bacterium]|nr:preprotein translocase subunit SecG [Patescibacteria group bacterium]